MRTSLILVTEGLPPAEAAGHFAAVLGLLAPGDQLIVTDSGSDPDLTRRLADLAEPENLPEGADLLVLSFGATPAAGVWTQANAALAEATGAALLVVTQASGSGDAPCPAATCPAATCPTAAAFAAARAEMAAGGADLVLIGGPCPAPQPPAPQPPDPLAQLILHDPAPILIRRDWLIGRGLRLAESGPAPGRLRHWQLCAAAGAIGWVADAQAPTQSAPPLATAEDLLALHRDLTAIGPGLQAPALVWLTGMADRVGPGLPLPARWQLAQALSAHLAGCAEPLWQEVLRLADPGAVAAIASALRRGAVPEIVTLWTQIAAESRMVRLEAEMAALRDSLGQTARGVTSLCQLAEFDARSAPWQKPEQDSPR